MSTIFKMAARRSIPKMLCAASLSAVAISGPTLADDGGFDPMASVTRALESVTEATGGRLRISGYLNGHIMNHDGMPTFVGKRDLNKDLTRLREFSFFIDASLIDGITVSTEVELANNFETVTFNYLYAEADFSALIDDWDEDELGSLTLRAGKMLVPFLSYNENKPNFRQNLMSQPLTAWVIVPSIAVPQRLDGLGWSDYGVMGNWSRAVGELGIIDIKLALMQGLQGNGTVLDSNSAQLTAGPTVRPRDGLFQNENRRLGDNNGNLAKVAKLSFRPFALPLDVGASIYSGKWDDESDFDLTMYGFHANYRQKNWGLKGEWVRADVEQAQGVNPVTAPGPAMLNRSTGDYALEAFYAEANVIPLRWGANGDNWVNLIVRYDESDTNNKAGFTPFDRRRWTFGGEYQFLPNMRLRFEYSEATLRDFERAPKPFIASGGAEVVTMRMVSLIANF